MERLFNMEVTTINEYIIFAVWWLNNKDAFIKGQDDWKWLFKQKLIHKDIWYPDYVIWKLQQ